MAILIGKFDDLIFDGRAVARSNRLYLPAIHGRAVEVFADNLMCPVARISDIAGDLRLRDLAGMKREGCGIIIAGLTFKTRKVDGAAIETGRRARLQTRHVKTEPTDRLAEQN